jgi:hypothetical protein
MGDGPAWAEGKALLQDWRSRYLFPDIPSAEHAPHLSEWRLGEGDPVVGMQGDGAAYRSR